MKNNTSLNVLGCVPSLLNILFELAEESNGIQSFQVIENIPINDKLKVFSPLNEWNVNFVEFYKNDILLNPKAQYAFSVVGGHSKKSVYDAFKKLVRMEDKQFINLIHPSSYVSRSVELNYGLQLEPLSMIAACTRIGFGVNVKRKCSVGHHCLIGNFATINPGVTISGRVKIGARTTIGSGSSVKDGVTIGENSIIGLGSVVVKDIPSNSIAFGNPCIVHKTNQKT